MKNFKISFRDIPAEGKSILLEEPSIWQNPIEEFKIDCQIVEPISINLFLLPIENGCLIKGSISGSVTLHCDCCAEDVNLNIKNNFETFESSPEDDSYLDEDTGEEMDLVIHDESRIVIENEIPMLNLAAICWEEFLISLPLKPLCQSDCKGLCVKCGVNLNQSTCDCSESEGDPRFAILRNYKAKDKN